MRWEEVQNNEKLCHLVYVWHLIVYSGIPKEGIERRRYLKFMNTRCGIKWQFELENNCFCLKTTLIIPTKLVENHNIIKFYCISIMLARTNLPEIANFTMQGWRRLTFFEMVLHQDGSRTWKTCSFSRFSLLHIVNSVRKCYIIHFYDSYCDTKITHSVVTSVFISNFTVIVNATYSKCITGILFTDLV